MKKYEGIKAKGHFAKFKEFFKTIYASFFIKEYRDLSQRPIKSAIEYFFSMLLICFVIMSILAIPKYLMLPQYIDNQFKKFDTFSVDVELKTNEPIKLTDSNPQITIDTAPNATLTKGRILINDKYVYTKSLAKINRYDWENYKNLKTNPDFFKKLFLFMLLATLPTIAILIFFTFAIKYLIEILIIVLIAFIILRIAKKTLPFRDIVAIAIYSSTVMILLDIISMPFSWAPFLLNIPILFFGINIIPLSLYLILFMIILIFLS